MRLHRYVTRLLTALTVFTVMLASPAHAEDKAFSEAELDQMLAPIALYPDSLLSQVLMACTYPADVKDAAAWSKAHPDVKGDAAVEQVASQPWEPAVQSLVAFPQLMAMLEAKPDQVQMIGDAFLADPGKVMDRVQFLRKKAQDAGNLKSSDQQKVSVTNDTGKQVIVVEPTQPSVVYVPVYQPSVVYGSWWYPAYPPVYWPPPPHYYPGGAFVAGVIWGAAITGIHNSLWGGFGWGHNEVNINVNRYNNINVNKRIDANNNHFNHNPDRRRDVPYRDSKSRDNFGKKSLDGARDREAYRGKDGRDNQRAQATDTLKSRGADPAAGRERLQGADRDKAQNAVNNSKARAPTGRDPGNAMSGVRNGSADRANVDRGRASHTSMNQQRATPSRPGGAGGAGAGAHRGGGGGGGRRH